MPGWCSAVVPAINYAQIPSTFKGLWMSRWPGFISLPLTAVSKTRLAQVVFSFSWFGAVSSPLQRRSEEQEPRGEQSSSSRRARGMTRGALPLHNSHTTSCATKGLWGKPGIPNHPLQPPPACTSPNHAAPALGMPARRMVPSPRRPTSLLWPLQSLCNSSRVTT